ncbi:Tyrosine-protein kinase sid-3 [Caenorhabditis elegans]|uniref:Tyrosine-protein kinase sid-3 n=1 Tax=Caenorhabditis elegans TaxID=6239 RepID=SID3_CAEEL|nr:Tyrosine-protein kinase sid-3 [Caenorhabditis elegans]Q10925.2 RecName: Full=Tyrosine-protein kinase sid-3; AltName: Full=Systemic RNA interference defective protein 3; AltName: Full=Systemic RNAi enabling protein [Caenorhabditis elegans]CCD61695.1 Tyrosine-protein kinase sid-3 [Caenorhabditis elegans]|eukprot:NP_510783.2 Tyrosine-protein kinase sid-3 [Caenorhabditis elegans]
MASTSGALVDDNVLEVLRKAQLDAFISQFVFLFNVRRFDHFSHVRDKDMLEIGMQQVQIRQLREQILKMSREMWNRSDPKQVYIQADQSMPAQNSIDEKALIPNEQIKLYELIGEGSFAVVKRGTWTQSNGTHVNVAVKILRDISPNIMDDLRVEASHLLKLQHPSLIRLYGIVRQPAMMVFELCEGGSLLDRLRDDKKAILLVSRLHDYCMQIAKALQFLESKHCVHRDVAARNILLARDERTVKICDFGLMRALKENEQMYTMAPQKKVPFAWCPPEALRHRKFSHASDVWSYGVTIWEVFTFGEEPWVGCRAIDVLKNIDAGERLEKPKYCSERIYQIMKNCWKFNPAERCKFGAIREDLVAAMFLDAVARETYNSIQPGALQLTKGDEVVVVENTGQDWFGQNKKNQKFGTFPRSVVFAQTNNAVAAATAVTPQKVPTAPTIRIPPSHPPPAPLKPLNNNTKTSLNDRTSKISMPVAGSFIHTGHGDPLGGQSWGNPATIADMYLKNPVNGAPLSSMSSGAEIIASKELLTNGGRSTHQPAAPSPAVMSKIRGLSLDLPEYDDFDRAFDDGFSPSKIELPREFCGNDSVISGGSNSIGLANTYVMEPPKQAFDIRGNRVLPPTNKAPVLIPTNPAPSVISSTASAGITLSTNSSQMFTSQDRHSNMPANLFPELQHRLNQGSSTGNGVRPRPASSIGIQNNDLSMLNPQVNRPFSVVNVPIVQQPANIPCLVPTPAPPAPAHFSQPVSSQRVAQQQQNTLQKALNDELKGNLNKRPTGTTAPPSNGFNAPRADVAPVQQRPISSASIPALQPQPIQHIQKPIQPQQVRIPPSTAPVQKPVQVSAPTHSNVAPTTSSQASADARNPLPPKTSPPVSNTPITVAPVHAAPTTSAPSTSVVTRRPTSTTAQMSDEERRSRIAMDISSALPAPSALLYGSNSTSSLPSAAVSTASSVPSTARDNPVETRPSQPHVTMPPKKSSEPILSSEVLQPTRLPSATTSQAKPVTQPIRHPSPPVATVIPTAVVDKKPVSQNQGSNVPLFNITNSSNGYPQLNGYPNYGNGFQAYGYGMNYHQGYPGYQGYNSYGNGMGQLALTHNAVTSLPPLVPSENRFSGTAQPLGESDIMEFLGTQQRQAGSSSRAVPPASASTSAASGITDLSMADKMEVLYREADFTHKGNCDTMVSQCNGNTEQALKLLKQQHLVDMELAMSTETARQALEARQYDLPAAANMLLG